MSGLNRSYIGRSASFGLLLTVGGLGLPAVLGLVPHVEPGVRHGAWRSRLPDLLPVCRVLAFGLLSGLFRRRVPAVFRPKIAPDPTIAVRIQREQTGAPKTKLSRSSNCGSNKTLPEEKGVAGKVAPGFGPAPDSGRMIRPHPHRGISWDKSGKKAVISRIAVSEYTLVHELVHLELASLPRSEASRKSEEHAVNRLTEALLELEQAGR